MTSSEYKKIWRKTKLAQGICGTCGNNPVLVMNGRKYTICQVCYDKMMKRNEANRATDSATALCQPRTRKEQESSHHGMTGTDESKIVRYNVYEPGEEKYREITDEICFTCEIPVEYCQGENCVSAYRRWKRKERQKAKRNTKHKRSN